MDLSAEFYAQMGRTRRKKRGEPKVSGWPLQSMAMGVGRRRVGEAIADARAKGVPTDFTPDGKAIFTSRLHQRAYCRAYGYHNNDESYSGRG